jgi:2-oxoisovalerate dehydrogenase E1 component
MMQDRNIKVKQRIIEAIESDSLPVVNSSFTPTEVGLSNTQLIDLFESQVMSRHAKTRSKFLYYWQRRP